MLRTPTRPARVALFLTLGSILATPMPASSHVVPGPPPCEDGAYLTLDVPGTQQAIICSGDDVGRFEFKGIPDGIGAVELEEGTVDVFVNHEESEVPFPLPPDPTSAADFQDSSVSRLTLDQATGDIIDAEVALPASAGFMRFCSASMAGPEQGLSGYTFFTNEETNDVVDVPPGAPYGPDPFLAPKRQGGYSVLLDVEDGTFDEVAGMGRHNHENTLLVPGGWDELAVVSTDDTFTPPTSQFYMYLAGTESDLWADQGELWAFRVTGTDSGRVDPKDPFNEANDYLDLEPGEEFRGRFIRVPDAIARGLTDARPQDALENWSNENNVFQFIRLEDVTYDKDNPRTLWVADTGATRVVPNPATGRMHRPSGVTGQADRGRIFQFVLDPNDPRVVQSLTVLADGDADPADPSFAPFANPDNLDNSANSLMVQEDISSGIPSRIWRMDLASGAWTQVAHVNVIGWESSGIIDASEWFGPGAWLLDVQGHGESFWVRHQEPTPNRPWFRRMEAGQLLLMTIDGT
jgi:hypothetical protein